MKKRVIILTGSELRHDFFRKLFALDPEIDVIQTFCEGTEKSLSAFIEKETDTVMRLKHLKAREESEKDFFNVFVKTSKDLSNPVFLPKGEINNLRYTEKIINLKPDLIIAYGCSLIKEPLLSAFPKRFLNVHLGLSPYYRGSGTNYWPLVNNEPEFVGATFMYIDAGIDTGDIIHQIRARITWGDTPSSIGNRLIKDIIPTYQAIVKNVDSLRTMPQPKVPDDEKVCKQKDYDEKSVEKLYNNFNNGMVEKYLSEINERLQKSPIVENPSLTDLLK
ncbi:MAG: formyl transferase [Candidatus Nomurabacteria bacterium]|nr:formyl transferase [Candidatus Nomurabacteria bacterium]